MIKNNNDLSRAKLSKLSHIAYFLTCLFLLMLSLQPGKAHALPTFSCEAEFYEIIRGDLHVVDPVTGGRTRRGPDHVRYNGFGYNVNDNYLYGVNRDFRSSTTHHLIRMGSDGNIEDLGDLGISSLAGDMDRDNNLYLVASEDELHKVNVITQDITTLDFNGSADEQALDVVYLESGNSGILVGVEHGKLHYYDLNTMTAGSRPIAGLPLNGVYGAIWTAAGGKIFASRNNAGIIYEIADPLGSPRVVDSHTGVRTNNQDGASCPLAPSPFEPAPTPTPTPEPTPSATPTPIPTPGPTATPAATNSGISGIIFEDLGYGGGPGRSPSEVANPGIPSAEIELYDNTGVYITRTSSDSTGRYGFSGLAQGDYYVRVVNRSVKSTRPGATGAEIPVMTYRKGMSLEIGGRKPEVEDAGNNSSGAARLGTNDFTFSGGSLNGQQAQSVQPLNVSLGDVNDADFGFNFNTVVNTNASGQGSLHQFVLNSNQLGSTGISQELALNIAPDYSAGDTVAVFMIPLDKLNNGEAVIELNGGLHLKRERIVIDGRVQISNKGQGLIILRGTGDSSGVFIDANANQSVLRELGILNFNVSAIIVHGADNTLIRENNLSGNSGHGVLLENGASQNTIIGNLIRDNSWTGIGSTDQPDNTFSQNRVADNGTLGIDLGMDGITLNSNNDSWINYPEVSPGSSISSNGTQIVAYDFLLDIASNSHGYRLEFFRNDEPDPSGHGEGLKYLGFEDITSSGIGEQNLQGSINADRSVPENSHISVTLTEKTGADTFGGTSEYSSIINGGLFVCTDLLADPTKPLAEITINENISNLSYLATKDSNGDPITYAISGSADGQFFTLKSPPEGALIDCLTVEFVDDPDNPGNPGNPDDPNNPGTGEGEGPILSARQQANNTIHNERQLPVSGNYETPADSDGDNTYEIFITATDINNNQVTKSLLVNVRDVNEHPSITNQANFSIPEGQSRLVTDLESSDPDTDDAEGLGIIYRISGGEDSGQFTVDKQSGELSFRQVPDYEQPTDADQDNVYEITVQAIDDQGLAGNKNLLISVTDDATTSGLNLQVRAMLQGAYDTSTGLMHDRLRSSGILPVAHPYDRSPFNYNGSEQLSTELATIEGEQAITDWVLVELRPANDVNQVIAAKAAIIRRDGQIIDASTGSINLNFAQASGSYYISLRHYNHLGVLVADPLSLSTGGPIELLDFSASNTVTARENSRHVVNNPENTGNVMLLRSGDINNDGRLIASGVGNDLSPLFGYVLTREENDNFLSNFKAPGYSVHDLNMDGFTLFTGPDNDANVLLGNILLHPENTGFLGNYIIQGDLATQ